MLDIAAVGLGDTAALRFRRSATVVKASRSNVTHQRAEAEGDPWIGDVRGSAGRVFVPPWTPFQGLAIPSQVRLNSQCLSSWIGGFNIHSSTMSQGTFMKKQGLSKVSTMLLARLTSGRARDNRRTASLLTRALCWMTLAALMVARSTAVAQGSLTPLGPPGPTFKTLQQVEPRTPISSLPFTISEPGSYYLTTSLTGNPGGITIAASAVILDLMGFQLVGGTGAGITVPGVRTNIVVRNGFLRGWSP